MSKKFIPLPESALPRVVIIGAGFGGLKAARTFDDRKFQVVLLDKNNYHQFQPLFYQVAMSGLEPSSIVFPLRKVFQKKKNLIFRSVHVKCILPESREVVTDSGIIKYDYLIIAIGADTNFFGNKEIARLAIPMKSISEALYLRNRILGDLEKAVNEETHEGRQSWLDIVIVGGGPTGVEVAGALAEMKKYILPKDYKELDADEIDIHLIDAGPGLLAGMSTKSGEKAEEFLKELGVIVMKNTLVVGYDGLHVQLSDGSVLQTRKLIWAAGVTGNKIDGIPPESLHLNHRIKVDQYCQVKGFSSVFAIGDIAYMEDDQYPKGHPQVAQVAIQQGKLVAENLNRAGTHRQKQKAFKYNDLGSMATIGKNKAVVDLPRIRFAGFIAWLVWLWVHLMSLIGVKNKILVMMNWVINYLTYDPSLRLIIRPRIVTKNNTTDKK
jgi:NADH:ubiquinone reductase (H+-translocating)